VALSPVQIAAIAKGVVEVFARLEVDLRVTAAKHIVREGVDAEAARRAIAATGGRYSREVERAIADAVVRSVQAANATDDVIYAAARNAGILGPLVPATDAAIVKAIIDAGILSAVNAGNLTATGAVLSTQAAFTAALDRALIETLSGTVSQTQAIRTAVDEIARFTPTVRYVAASGRVIERSVYGAVRSAVTTAAHQTVGRVQFARADAMGVRHVEVSAHVGARPSHAEWQGQVYGYPEPFTSICGYGAVDGIYGVHCGHSAAPFLPEIMEPTDYSEVLSRDAERDYELSQRQRLCERNVREYAGRAEVYRAAGETDAARRYEGLAAKWTGEARAVARQRGDILRLDRMEPTPNFK